MKNWEQTLFNLWDIENTTMLNCSVGSPFYLLTPCLFTICRKSNELFLTFLDFPFKNSCNLPFIFIIIPYIGNFHVLARCKAEITPLHPWQKQPEMFRHFTVLIFFQRKNLLKNSVKGVLKICTFSQDFPFNRNALKNIFFLPGDPQKWKLSPITKYPLR